MPMKDTALEIRARLSASGVEFLVSSGGGAGLEDLRVESVEINGTTYSRQDLAVAFGSGAVLMLDTWLEAAEDGDGWGS